jgi:hypothetical protein
MIYAQRLKAFARGIAWFQLCALAAPGPQSNPSAISRKRRDSFPPGGTCLDHDAIKWNRIMISSLCLSMIFSESRFPLFRIML